MKQQTNAPEALESLRDRVKQQGSIASVAREVDMPRAWLSRVLSPKTGEKLKEVEQIVADKENEVPMNPSLRGTRNTQ